MTTQDNFHKYEELSTFLKGQGYNDTQIHQIISQVQEYEVDMRIDSIMDSIGNGQLDLEAVIGEALKRMEE
ncbi:hypothetical protein AB1L30_21585 [Bremerella sp. JC817]|uniref:hypothetical protein n=1 Tax=Bremerella sp. JC817 TaxID=3231756 RepID=UPI00345AE0E9